MGRGRRQEKNRTWKVGGRKCSRRSRDFRNEREMTEKGTGKIDKK